MKSPLFLFFLIFLFSCKKEKSNLAKFKLLSASETGLDFVNQITPNNDQNIFQYMYFYNGGGVAAGDFNKDGKTDLFFTANQTANKLYLNRGNMHFEDITNRTGIESNGGWSNGVSVVDINNDGNLDIYVSQVDNGSFLKGVNQLWINNGIDSDSIPHFEESAEKYGLALKAFGTQAVFMDFDQDGDLDFFQLNHSVHQNATFGKRELFLGKFHPTAGDRYFENIDGKYQDKTTTCGINSNSLGYGLGLVAGDINLDGKPDIYVGNDFHENDYLYINQGKGNFLDRNDSMLAHTSRFSMGVDLADINNDIFPELISLDMLPFESEMLKKSEGEDAFYNFNFKLKQGYNYQFARNALQLNNGNNTFSEIAMFSGVHATDWSWSSLFLDFDNDGFKDLFISNGINKRMNDTDYMNYVSNDEIQAKINRKEFNESDEVLTKILPEAKMPNKFFENKGDLTFEDLQESVSGNKSSYSNGAIYADLDNDGDLDIVTNNINDPAFIYENLTNERNKSLILTLKGPEKNLNAIGTKIFAYSGNKVIYQEKLSVRGFQSSAETDVYLGLGKSRSLDSLVIIWPDNTYEKILTDSSKLKLEFKYKPDLPVFNYSNLCKKTGLGIHFTDVTKETGVDFTHKENQFVEFDREALIPAKMSTEGPAIAVSDINDDGLDDFIIGSSKKEKPVIYLQNQSGKFTISPQPFLDADSTYEEIDFAWADVNGDGLKDLLIADGGNEYYGKNEYQKPRLFLNTKNGIFQPAKEAFPPIYETASCIEVNDVDNDGDQDVFLGCRTVAWAYGQIPRSYLLLNDGKGNFSDRTPENLKFPGMVTDAKWADLNNDNNPELVICTEWGGIFSYDNKWQKKLISAKKGWWKRLYISDLDQDGDLDITAGNLGLNSRLKTSEKEPIRMYVNDYDDNGRLDQILTYYIQGRETIFADKKEIEKQLPFIRKKFNLSADFAKASIPEIFGKDKMNSSKVFIADCFENSIFINDGKGNFDRKALPTKAQLSPLFAFYNFNNGKKNYLLSLGNFYDSNIQMGRYDASFGQIVYNPVSQITNVFPIPDMKINGQVKTITEIKTTSGPLYLIGINDQKMQILKASFD